MPATKPAPRAISKPKQDPEPDNPIPKPEPVPEKEPAETREDKLVRLATARVSAAIKRIELIGNLAAYKPNENDVNDIMLALGTACAAVENRLRGVVKVKQTFSLRSIPSNHG